MRRDCGGTPLPEREIKFRGINSKAQRDEDMARNIGSIEVCDDWPDYQGYHADEEESSRPLGNGAGQTKVPVWPNARS